MLQPFEGIVGNRHMSTLRLLGVAEFCSKFAWPLTIDREREHLSFFHRPLMAA